MMSVFGAKGTFWSRPNGISLFDIFSIAFVISYLILVYRAVVIQTSVAVEIQGNMNILMTTIIGSYAGDQITNRIVEGQVARANAPSQYSSYTEKDFEGLL